MRSTASHWVGTIDISLLGCLLPLSQKENPIALRDKVCSAEKTVSEKKKGEDEGRKKNLWQHWGAFLPSFLPYLFIFYFNSSSLLLSAFNLAKWVYVTLGLKLRGLNAEMLQTKAWKIIYTLPPLCGCSSLYCCYANVQQDSGWCNKTDLTPLKFLMRETCFSYCPQFIMKEKEVAPRSCWNPNPLFGKLLMRDVEVPHGKFTSQYVHSTCNPNDKSQSLTALLYDVLLFSQYVCRPIILHCRVEHGHMHFNFISQLFSVFTW